MPPDAQKAGILSPRCRSLRITRDWMAARIAYSPGPRAAMRAHASSKRLPDLSTELEERPSRFTAQPHALGVTVHHHNDGTRDAVLTVVEVAPVSVFGDFS